MNIPNVADYWNMAGMRTWVMLWGLHGSGGSMLLPELIEEALHCSGISHASCTGTCKVSLQKHLRYTLFNSAA